MKYLRDEEFPTTVDSFAKAVQSLAGTQDVSEVWRDFVELSSCTISNAMDKARFDVRERDYCSIAKKYGKDGMAVMAKLFASTVLALENNPAQDFLGSVYTGLRLQQPTSWAGLYAI